MCKFKFWVVQRNHWNSSNKENQEHCTVMMWQQNLIFYYFSCYKNTRLVKWLNWEWCYHKYIIQSTKLNKSSCNQKHGNKSKLISKLALKAAVLSQLCRIRMSGASCRITKILSVDELILQNKDTLLFYNNISFSRLNASSHPSAKLVGPCCQQTHKLDTDDLGKEVTFQPKGSDFSTKVTFQPITSCTELPEVNFKSTNIINATLLKQMGYSLFNLYFDICKLFSSNSWTSLSALKIYVFINMLHWPHVCGHIKVAICAKYYCWPTGVCYWEHRVCLLGWSDWNMNWN